MMDVRDFLQTDESDDFQKSFKEEMTKRVFAKLDDMKRTMAKDYLTSDENESS